MPPPRPARGSKPKVSEAWTCADAQQSSAISRRAFFKNSIAGANVLYASAEGSVTGVNAATARCGPEAKRHIRSAEIGEPIIYPKTYGDTWIATWADDDNVYCISDDTKGFDHVCNSNLAINRIAGSEPPDIRGVTINPMQEYGHEAETRKDDLAMWKGCGIISVDGVLYLTVSRHLYAEGAGACNPFIVQETWDASIVKSTDHGKTWSAKPELNRPTFCGRMFSTPFFVQYGKDGAGSKDGADKYVYAVSNDGAWDNGNWMTLGRVRKDRIGRLDCEDWEFVHGYNSDGSPLWQPRHDSALYIFLNPGRTSMAGIHYLAPLDVYILPQWYYTHREDPERMWGATRLEFYEAPAPWGPWSLFHAQDFEPQGWYNPSIPSKYISRDGKHLWLFIAGWPGTKWYALYMMPMTLEISK